MQRTPWTLLSKETAFECAYYRLSHDRYVLPTGDVGDYHYIDIPGSTMIVPRLADGRLVLVSQFRYLIGRSSVEFPAGGIPRGVEPLENATRELEEETGYRAERIERVGAFAPYNGVSNEMCHVFSAEGLVAGPAAPETTEEFELLALTPDEVRRRIADGELWDGMTIASFHVWEAARSGSAPS